MKEILKMLYNLQEIDLNISFSRENLKKIPDKETECDIKIKKAEEEVEELKTELKNVELRKDTREREIEETRMNLTKHKTQLLSAKTNKEYSALLKEIEGEEKKVENAEEETLKGIIETERLSKELEEKSKEASEIKRTQNAEKVKLNAERKRLESLIESKEKEREQIATHIPSSYLARYDRIRRGRGNAIALVKNGMCTGCNILLPLQFITLIRRGKQIHNCEECGRILIWHEDVE